MKRFLHRLRTLVWISLFVGSVSSFFALFQEGSFSPTYLIYGLLDGVIIGALIAFYVLFIVRGTFSDLARRTPFVLLLAINTAAYVLVFVFARAWAIWITGRGPFDIFPYDRGHFQSAAIFALIISLTINFFMQISQLLGQNTLWNFLLGKYHRPASEFRFVMYLDLAGSTSIAEKLGDKQFLALLNDFFYDMTDAVLETGADIYKYVGDEAILLWTRKRGVKRNDALRFIAAFARTLRDAEQKYALRYGLVPEFRAGLHYGQIVAGEMGNLRQEVAYMGDAMNTGARVLDVAKKLKKTFIVSEDALSQFNVPGLEDLGEHELRGKEKRIRLYGAPDSLFEEFRRLE